MSCSLARPFGNGLILGATSFGKDCSLSYPSSRSCGCRARDNVEDILQQLQPVLDAGMLQTRRLAVRQQTGQLHVVRDRTIPPNAVLELAEQPERQFRLRVRLQTGKLLMQLVWKSSRVLQSLPA